MYMVLIVISLSFLLAACSSTFQVEDIPTEQEISAQEDILNKLYLGQPKEDVLKLMTYPSFHSFDVMEGENYYSYISKNNFDTNVGFGLYFERGMLEALILDDDVNDLFSCRTLFRTNSKHWLSHGIKPYQTWIKSKDHLATGLYYRTNHSKMVTKQKTADKVIGNTLSLIVYSPFIVAAAPFIIHDEMSGKTKDKQELHAVRLALANGISIGETEEYILTKLGPPEQVDHVANTKVLTYYGPSYSYGIKDGVVTWIEHYSMFELHSRQRDYGNAFYGNTECGSLDDHWQANKRVN